MWIKYLKATIKIQPLSIYVGKVIKWVKTVESAKILKYKTALARYLKM